MQHQCDHIQEYNKNGVGREKNVVVASEGEIVVLMFGGDDGPKNG